MTVYGGEETTWGTRKGGFYIVCCKCGWESHVTVQPGVNDTVVFVCHKCGNQHVEGVD